METKLKRNENGIEIEMEMELKWNRNEGNSEIEGGKVYGKLRRKL